MFTNLQIRPAKPGQRKPSMANRAGVTKTRHARALSNPNAVPSLSFMENLFGDEFPEAFASSVTVMRKSKATILDLPDQVLNIVCESLSKSDIKRLRLAHKSLAKKVELPIDRIFIAPNRADLDCLHNILRHPRYRTKVQEIVWNDAQLEEHATLEDFCDAVHKREKNMAMDIEKRLEDIVATGEDGSSEFRIPDYEDFFQRGQLTAFAKGLLLRYDDGFAREFIGRNAAMLSLEDSYAIYQRIYHEQRDILARRDDVAALRAALGELPNLQRIAVTREVLGEWNWHATYDSPFFRSLPVGFRVPASSGQVGNLSVTDSMQEGHCAETRRQSGYQESRGYDIILSALNDISRPQVKVFFSNDVD